MIQSQYVPETYIGNDVNDVFAFTWRILAKSDLVATIKNTSTNVETVLVLDLDYTIADEWVNTENGGYIVLADPLPTNRALLIQRSTAKTQLLNLEEGGTFPAAAITAEFDRLTMIMQEQEFELVEGRAIIPVVVAQYDSAAVVTHNLNSVFVKVAGFSATWQTTAAIVAQTADTITLEFSNEAPAVGMIVVSVAY